MLNKRFFLTALSLTMLVAFTNGCRKPKAAGGAGGDDDFLDPNIANVGGVGGVDDGSVVPWGTEGDWGTPLAERGPLGDVFVPVDLNIQNVLFGYDSSNVEPSERYKVETVAGYIIDNPGVSVVIEGNADERGSSDYNLALSERRALAIRDYMLSMGAPAAAVHTSAMGEENPISFGHDENAWQMNRRGEFRFYK